MEGGLGVVCDDHEEGPAGHKEWMNSFLRGRGRANEDGVDGGGRGGFFRDRKNWWLRGSSGTNHDVDGRVGFFGSDPLNSKPSRKCTRIAQVKIAQLATRPFGYDRIAHVTGVLPDEGPQFAHMSGRTHGPFEVVLSHQMRSRIIRRYAARVRRQEGGRCEICLHCNMSNIHKV